MRNSYFILTLIIALFIGCQSNDVHVFMAYFNDPTNGLIDKTETNLWEYYIQYRSPEYMALIELGEEIQTESLVEATKSYEDFDYYLFKMRSKKSAKAKSLFSNEESQKYSMGWQKGIVLVQGIDTLEPSMIHFENLLGVTGEVRFLTAFEKMEDKNRTFLINSFNDDDVVQLELLASDLKKIPNINL